MGGAIMDLLIGDYDWGFLCTPRLPWGKRKNGPPLFEKDAKISIFLSLVMGSQHALAMVGGIITVPLVISGSYYANFNSSQSEYIISAALICSGLASLIQVTQIPIPFTNYAIGSGLLSVMGISFTFLPIAESSITILRECACDGVPCDVGGSCDTCTGVKSGSCLTGPDAYGKLLGTIMVCCLLEVGLSFAPPKVLRKLFPPVVSGVTVLLIGFALVTTGFEYWGGGVYCGQQVLTSMTPCDQNGEVVLPFGSPQYVGLGFVVFSTLAVVELFGSPFMRNIQVVLGLLVGMIVASSLDYKQCTQTCTDGACPFFNVLPEGLSYNNATGTVSGKSTGITFVNSTSGSTGVYGSDCAAPVCEPEVCTLNRYVTGAEISAAPWITFLWVHTFNIGFYAPAVLPMLFGFMVTTIETIGDVTATAEASGLIPAGPFYERSVQGGILADGLNCFWSALATMLPTTTYSQNNGVISLTRCGARRAGWACGAILMLLGIIAKIAGVILTIPDCILGGMTTFLFINVAISGMRILTMGEGITRRNRFIAAMAMSIGIGVELVPAFINISGQSEYPFEGNFWPLKQSWSSGYRGFRDALIIVLSTGFSIGGFIALFMNLILPHDLDDVDTESGAAHATHDTAYSTGTADREKNGMLFDKPHEQEMVA